MFFFCWCACYLSAHSVRVTSPQKLDQAFGSSAGICWVQAAVVEGLQGTLRCPAYPLQAMAALGEATVFLCLLTSEMHYHPSQAPAPAQKVLPTTVTVTRMGLLCRVSGTLALALQQASQKHPTLRRPEVSTRWTHSPAAVVAVDDAIRSDRSGHY